MATDKQDAIGGTGEPGEMRSQGGGKTPGEAGVPNSKPRGNLLPKNAPGEMGAPVELRVPPGVRVVKASEFKAKCLQLMDEVAASGEEIIITKRGRPVSRLAPYRERPKSLFGVDKGRIEILGDIVAPLEADWEAERDPDRVLEP